MRYVILTLPALFVGCSPPPSPNPAEAENQTAQHPTPLFPIAEQDSYLSKGWSFRLPGKFRQRVEDDNLIFWRQGLTIYTVVWTNDKKESAAQRLSWIKEHASLKAFEVQELQDGGVVRFSYRLTEDRAEGTVHALYGYAIGQNAHVQFAAYCDRETEIDVARKIWLSITEHPDSQQH